MTFSTANRAAVLFLPHCSSNTREASSTFGKWLPMPVVLLFQVPLGLLSRNPYFQISYLRQLQIVLDRRGATHLFQVPLSLLVSRNPNSRISYLRHPQVLLDCRGASYLFQVHLDLLLSPTHSRNPQISYPRHLKIPLDRRSATHLPPMQILVSPSLMKVVLTSLQKGQELQPILSFLLSAVPLSLRRPI